MLTPHISVVHVPVNAIGKKRSNVFCFPKLSLNLICFGPSAVLLDKVKSGAFVPTASGIGTFSIRSTSIRSKKLRSVSDGGSRAPPRDGTICGFAATSLASSKGLLDPPPFLSYNKTRGTLLVALCDRVLCRRVNRHGCADSPWAHHHSGRCGHSSHDARPGEKHRLADDRRSRFAYPRDLRARFSRQLFRRKIFRRNQMGDVRRHHRRAHRPFLRNYWLVRRSRNRGDRGRIQRWQENDRCGQSGLGEFARQSRRDDRQTRDRAGHEHDLPHDGAAADLKQVGMVLSRHSGSDLFSDSWYECDGRSGDASPSEKAEKSCCIPCYFVIQSEIQMNDRSRAEEDLRVIRTLMERATIYRAISVPTALVGGGLSILSAVLIHLSGYPESSLGRVIRPREFAFIWIDVLVLTVIANAFFVWREAKSSGRPSLSSGMRLALRAIAPNLIVPALFTIWFLKVGV